ncbi:hypothetical protein CBOM_05557 [Ceraceosorus bombacis]|uniref:Uncharacterized protein n=1 Tax=Ceraceosorus bombacis TaxID=401625 RepID=A0A0P1BR52_9BASI|nr:hypothetical protein CBOM_05557 [Ceraceosorus bombacis]
MDHGVAYQPEAISPTHAKGPSAGRLSNLFSKSLRKASSSRELASSGGYGHTWQARD